MRLIILSAVIATCSLYSIGQKGFLGARNAISLSAFGNVPLLSGSFKDPSYEKRGEQMKETKDWLDYGFKFKYVAGLKRNFGLGLVASYNYFQVNSQRKFGLNYLRASTTLVDSFSLQMENVGINKFSFMPVFEFYHKKGLSPVGLYHTIGFGYSFAKIQNGFYAYSVSKSPGEAENALMSPVDYYELDQDWKSFQFIELMFGIGMKAPISKRLAVDFGVNYNVNIALKPSNESLLQDIHSIYNYENIYYNVRREVLGTIVANVGIVFVL